MLSLLLPSFGATAKFTSQPGVAACEHFDTTTLVNSEATLRAYLSSPRAYLPLPLPLPLPYVLVTLHRCV